MFSKFFGKKKNDFSADAPNGGEPIVNELVLPMEAANDSDPYKILQCNIDAMNFLLTQCYFMPYEMIPVASTTNLRTQRT